MILFLLALLVGLIVPKFAVPRLGLSTHLLGIMQGIFLMVAGLLWPTLRFSSRMSRIGVFLAVYGCFAAWIANLTAAIIGAGNSMLPIAAGSTHGSPLQETLITIALRSAAASLIAVTILVLWGLRRLRLEDLDTPRKGY
ncbi:MAG TPA: hydrogenase [Thermoanaerobaculia bacterium]